MTPEDLIVVARRLAQLDGDTWPSDAGLRRAVSTAYYALFHAICESVAGFWIGASTAEGRGRAWRQAYRAVEHRRIKTACEKLIGEKPPRFSQNLLSFAEQLLKAQSRRHRADYDPDARFTPTHVQEDIDAAATALYNFKQASAEERRAFVTWLVLPDRKP